MQGLSNEQIVSLLNAPRRVRAAKAEVKPNAFVRVGEKIELQVVSPTHFGAFSGKAGSLHRTSKGATRRALNGSRRYVKSTDIEVVAYRA